MSKQKRERVPEMHYYEWSTARWFSSRTRLELDGVGRNIYRELIDMCYGTGSCPKDPVIQARLCAVTEADIARTWPLIKRHFETNPEDKDTLIHGPASTARDAYFAFINRQSKAGKASAKAKAEAPSLEPTTSATDVEPAFDSGSTNSATKEKEKGKEDSDDDAAPRNSSPPSPKLVPKDWFDAAKGLEEVLALYPVQRGIDGGGRIYIGEIRRLVSPREQRELHSAIIAGIERHLNSSVWRDRDTGELQLEYIPDLEVFMGGRPRRGSHVTSRMYLDHPPQWKPKKEAKSNSFLEALKSA